MIKPQDNDNKFLRIKKQNQYKNWYLSLLFLKLHIVISDNSLVYLYNPIKQLSNWLSESVWIIS